MGVNQGCCSRCSNADNKEQVAAVVQPSEGSREEGKKKGNKVKSSPSNSPRGKPGAASRGACSPVGSKASSPRGQAQAANSGGTGETPDNNEEGMTRTGSTGASGLGLAKKAKEDRQSRAARASVTGVISKALIEEDDKEAGEDGKIAQPPSFISLKERVGRKSFLEFSAPKQTIIIFDWDDTLFPTTWIQEDMEVNVSLPCPKTKEVVGPLKQCCSRAADVLRLATSVAEQVSIVTLAESPWVDYTIRNFYQSMEKTLQTLGIRIIYARDAAAEADGGSKDRTKYDKHSFQSSEERAAYWTGVKGTAIRIECERFYTKYEEQTWKNVISFGDSDFEKEGTIEVTRQYVLSKKQKGAYQLPRTKTVKFLDSPTAEELCNELRLVKHWLPTLVHKDEGFNLDFENIGQGNVEDIGELLKDATAFEAEPRSEALFDNLFWKKDKNGDPFNENHWRPRRIWLSKSGRMWYESLKDVKAMELFGGASVGDLEATKLQGGVDILASIEGMPIFGISFKAISEAHADMFVLTSEQEREELLKHIGSFKKETRKKVKKSPRGGRGQS